MFKLSKIYLKTICKSIAVICAVSLLFGVLTVTASPLYNSEDDLKQTLFDWFNEKYSFGDIDKFSYQHCCSFDDNNILVFNIEYAELEFLTVITHKRIGNRILYYPSSDDMMAVYDGNNVYDIESAYDNKLLDDEKLDIIAASGAKFLWIRKFRDFNIDGKITVSDIVELRKVIMDNSEMMSDMYYDIDEDGKCTVSDIVKLRAIIMD